MASCVAILKTSPGTVIEDYKSLIRLGCYRRFLPKDKQTALKIYISWHYFYPACSTTPWQLDGVIATLLEDGYRKEKLYGCQNRTVVVSARRGEIANKHRLSRRQPSSWRSLATCSGRNGTAPRPAAIRGMRGPLKWSTTSPPPEYNYATLPEVRSRRPLWDLKHPEDLDWYYE